MKGLNKLSDSQIAGLIMIITCCFCLVTFFSHTIDFWSTLDTSNAICETTNIVKHQ